MSICHPVFSKPFTLPIMIQVLIQHVKVC
uniref:Uncharacterized protein n=1 Tax=Anguilla anguilla TaxID=7936 RepID=A0A0E9RJL3_ANGAN